MAQHEHGHSAQEGHYNFVLCQFGCWVIGVVLSISAIYSASGENASIPLAILLGFGAIGWFVAALMMEAFAQWDMCNNWFR